jgi:hypothetical protein
MLEFVVKKAEMNHLMDCKAALCNSKLGDEYFPSEEKAHNILREGIKKGKDQGLLPFVVKMKYNGQNDSRVPSFRLY